MQELVEFIVRGLLGEDCELSVTEELTERERTIHIHVPGEDRGVVIGRQGRTIRAIETLLAAAPAPDGRRSAVKVD